MVVDGPFGASHEISHATLGKHVVLTIVRLAVARLATFTRRGRLAPSQKSHRWSRQDASRFNELGALLICQNAGQISHSISLSGVQKVTIAAGGCVVCFPLV